jgi:hypothetical protein
VVTAVKMRIAVLALAIAFHGAGKAADPLPAKPNTSAPFEAVFFILKNGMVSRITATEVGSANIQACRAEAKKMARISAAQTGLVVHGDCIAADHSEYREHLKRKYDCVNDLKVTTGDGLVCSLSVKFVQP